MTLTRPQKSLTWNHTAEDILQSTVDAIRKHLEIQDRIGALDTKDCDFGSVFLALAESDAELDAVTGPLTFYRHVSPKKGIRDAAHEAETLVRKHRIQSSSRLDVYAAKVAAEKNIKASGQWEKYSTEEQRLVEEMVLDGKRAGLGLPQAKREELTKLEEELEQIGLQFNNNFNAENSVLTFSEEELKGVPKPVVDRYAKRMEGDKHVYDVTYKLPDIGPVSRFAEVPITRKRAHEGYESRLEVNVPLFDKILETRRRIAALLGYRTWADYIAEVSMFRSGRGAQDFLNEFESELRPIAQTRVKHLLELKRKEHEDKGLDFNNQFDIWDYPYYDGRYDALQNPRLNLDHSLVKEYFPVSVVVPTTFLIYQDLFGVRLEEIEASAWHPGVQQFAVWDKDATDGSSFLGYCYLDLFLRENKRSPVTVWHLIPGYENHDGTRSYPVTALVANLPKTTPEKPALLRHDEVVTLFREIGQALRGLLSKTRFARFHVTSVAPEFSEALSQMFENWCWEPRVLEQLSSHYETKKTLPPELTENIIKSRYINTGMFYLIRQLFLAQYDSKVHNNQEKDDYTNLWTSLRKGITFTQFDKKTPGQGTFVPVVTGGYDARYYRYLLSPVIAADIYASVFKCSPLDPARGKLYKDKILQWSGVHEELDSLKNLLGRPPNSNAFIEEVFGAVRSSSHL